MRPGSRWLGLLAALAGPASCLLVDDLGELEPIEEASSSSVSSVSAGGSGGSSSSSDATTSSSTGGSPAGAGGSPLTHHGNVLTIRTNAEPCRVEITGLAAFDDDIYVAGVTTALGAEDCATVGPAVLFHDAKPGTSMSWYGRFSQALDAVWEWESLGEPVATSELEPSRVHLAVSANRIFAAFDGGLEIGSGARTVVVRDITEAASPIDFVLAATSQLRLTDLFSAGGRVYATGVVDGATHAAGACNGGVSAGSFEQAGFVWSIDASTCQLGAFGDHTAVAAGIAANAITLGIAGQPMFGGGASPCDAVDGDATLSLVDTAIFGADGLAQNCLARTLLGEAPLPLPARPILLASNPEHQIVGLQTPGGERLVKRLVTTGALAGEIAFVGTTRLADVFASPGGALGAVGHFQGGLTYGELTASSESGAGFVITFDGSTATSFVLDDLGDEAFTAALATPEGVYLAGQWQEGLGDALGMEGDLLDPFGTAAFLTLLPER